MNPEPVPNPMESPTSASQAPMTMERTLSSASGSNSSFSTEDSFAKASNSRSPGPSLSRSGSAASTSRSAPEQDAAARTLSPHGAPPASEPADGQEDKSSKKIPSPSSKTDAFRQYPNNGIKGTKDPPGSDQAVGTIAGERFQESEQARYSEENDADKSFFNKYCYCCKCCESCCESYSVVDFAGDVLSVVCCPFSIVHLVLSCLCCKCPKMFASKTKEQVSQTREKVKIIKSGGKKGEKSATRMNHKEESDLEEAESEAAPGSPDVKPTKSPEKSWTRSFDPGVTDVDQPSDKMEKPPGFAIDDHRNYFFPSPEVEDDHPGGERAGGR